jgi:hypothetical protein
MDVLRTRLIIVVLLAGVATGTIPAAAQPVALDARALADAIAWGRSGDPEPYRIFHAPGEGRNWKVVGLAYTPYLRVALAARAAAHAGVALDPGTLPAWLVAPVVYVAVRWYAPCGGAGADRGLSVKATTPDATLSRVVFGTDGIPPIRVFAPAMLKQLNDPPPFDDIAHVVTYPLELLRQDTDLVVFKQDSPEQLCAERGRILRSSTEKWR